MNDPTTTRDDIISEHFGPDFDADEWTGRKYDSPLAEALDTIDETEAIGRSDTFGHYRRYDDACSILAADSAGFVSAEEYATLADINKEWDRLGGAYDEFLVGYVSDPVVTVEASDHSLSFFWDPTSAIVEVRGIGWNRGDKGSFRIYCGGDVPTTADFLAGVRDFLRSLSDD